MTSGLVPTKEPYAKRTSHGMILGEGGRKDVQIPRQRREPERHRSASTARIRMRVYIMFIGDFDESRRMVEQRCGGLPPLP